MKILGQYLWLSQYFLFGGLAICTLIIPGVAKSEGGVSNFGNHLATFIFYSLAFVLNALFIWLAADHLAKISPKYPRLSQALTLVSVLTLAVWISTFPRHFNYAYSIIHDDLGILLYSCYFAVSAWIVYKLQTTEMRLFLVLQLIGSIIGALAVAKVIHLLYIGQLLGALGFGLIICRGLPEAVQAPEVTSKRSF